MRQLVFVLLAMVGMLPASLLPVVVSVVHDGPGLPITQSIVGADSMAGVFGAIGAAVLGVRHGRLWPVLGASAAGLATGPLVVSGNGTALFWRFDRVQSA